MEREIKFRAWDGIRITKSGIMFNSSTGCMEVPTIGSFGSDLTKVSKYYLMQYTGLSDKNGVEIYEGDVLKITSRTFWNDEIDDIGRYEDLVYVKIHTLIDTYCYYCSTKEKWNNGQSYSDWSDDWYEKEYVEVIGNIYKNPELLKQQTTHG